MDGPRLRRGLFGYSRRSVRIALAERDARVLAATEREREARARVRELESRLAGAEALALELRAEAGALLEGLEAQTARRDFLREHARAEAALARAAAPETGPFIVLPDLEAASGNGARARDEIAHR